MSGGSIEFVGPSVNDGIRVETVHRSHDAILRTPLNSLKVQDLLDLVLAEGLIARDH